jgi:hypothetical protein
MSSSYFDNKELFTGPTTHQYGNHMVMTNVSKETKVKYINIDTRFRDEYNYSATTNYNITLPQRITEVKNISVTNVELPITFYTISENLGNNSFKIIHNSTSYIFIIPDGNYNSTQLLTKINNIIIGMGLDIVFAIDNIDNKIKATTTTTPSHTINFDVDSTGNFAKYNFKFRLGWLLGFRKPTYEISPAKQLKAECLPDLTGPRYLYLVIDEFTSNGNQSSFVSPLPTSLINKNVLARIPISQTIYPFASVYPFNRSNGLLSDCRSYTGKVDIQKLNVQLVNENGIVMDLNGADFSFCIRLEHE